MTSVEARESPAAVVFGGRSPIAVSCARHLAETQVVVLVTRRIDDDIQRLVGSNPRIALVEADLEAAGESRRVVESIYASGHEVSAAVFLQRYRPTDEGRFDLHSQVELWSIQEALEAIRDNKTQQSEVYAVLSSSPAVQTVLLDQDLHYHIIKASQEALVRFYSVVLARDAIHVNALRIGSVVLKPRAAAYWTSVPDLVMALRNAAPRGELVTSDDVGRFIARLATAGLVGMTGQTVTLDDGLSLRDGIQMVRGALERSSDRD